MIWQMLLFVSESDVVKYNFNYNENAPDKEIIYKILSGDVDRGTYGETC